MPDPALRNPVGAHVPVGKGHDRSGKVATERVPFILATPGSRDVDDDQISMLAKPRTS